MRIIHLSDIHLHKNNLDDIGNFVIPALIKDLSRFNSDIPIDLILFSGDLIDRGGVSYGDVLTALSSFEERIICPISKALSLRKDRFFFAPGNHDVDREADDDIVDLGLTQRLTNEVAVNKFIQEGKCVGTARISDFKTFEGVYYDESSHIKRITTYQSSFSLVVDSINVGLTCFNSAWRCYKRESDKGSLIVGERQVIDARSIITSADIKIAVIHHPLDWLADFDNKSVSPLITKDYHLLFCGHAHEQSTWTKCDMYGALFVSVAPANWTYDLRSEGGMRNGYAVIDYDPAQSQVAVSHRRYSHGKEDFVPNTDQGDGAGKCVFSLPSSRELAKFTFENSVAETIRTGYFRRVDEHLLNYNTDSKAPKDIAGLFVLPPIVGKIEYSVEDQPKEQIYTMEDILETKSNMLIFGQKESGKTVLLDEILIELTNGIHKYHKIPVLLDFEELGTRGLDSIIGSFLRIGHHQINSSFVKENKIVLLIDNLNFSKMNRASLERLESFINKYKGLQIIATSSQTIEGEPPLEFFEYTLYPSFVITTIKSLKTEQIRELINRWFSKNPDYDGSGKLEKLFEFFTALHLPRAPLTVSMFLWMIEQQSNYKPLNQATMLENFIERLFKKLSKKEIYSEVFDYRNKEHLLTDLAHHMYQQGQTNYRIPYIDLCNYIDALLKIKKFNGFMAEEVLQHFISKGILAKESDESQTFVRFRFTCFFEYFLMKNMDRDSEFKSFVTDEDNFLKFTNEIDYYTGLKRDQSDILRALVDRMYHEYSPIIESINKLTYGFDDVFMKVRTFTSNLGDDFVKGLQSKGKPSQSDTDKIKDEILETLKQENGIRKKEEQIDPFSKLERLWTLAAKVLKNTEETKVEGLKDDSYRKIIICAMAYAVLFKIRIDRRLEKDAESLKPGNKEFLMLLQDILPLIHEVAVYTLMGTAKLRGVIKDKIFQDKMTVNISDFERFMSIFLYSDVEGPESKNYITDFVKRIKKGYIVDMVLFKIVTNYFRSKNASFDRFCENILAELIVRSRGLARMKKGKIIQDYRDARLKTKSLKK